MRVLHVTTKISRESFGLGQVAINLAKAESDLCADVRIWCLDQEDQIGNAVVLPGFSPSNVRGFASHGLLARVGYSQAMISSARSDGKYYDVVHQHGIWTACSLTTNILHQVHRAPTVIAPHGSLQQWALKRSAWKKRLALLAYERRNLENAACLHATSEAEIDDCRNYGLSNPIALIPNGISGHWLESHGDGSRFRERFAIPPDRRLLLFLSRITPKKGLPLLLEAINCVRGDFSNSLLIIAGIDEFGHLKEAKSLVKKLGLEHLVAFTGPLFDQAKLDAFAACHAFVLPSYSEGAPMIVLEALESGLPVITTRGTPWQSLTTFECGWWVEVSVQGLICALQEFLSLSKDQLRLMGSRGRELVKSKYLWRTQGQKALDLYGWILGRQAKPDFVIAV